MYYIKADTYHFIIDKQKTRSVDLQTHYNLQLCTSSQSSAIWKQFCNLKNHFGWVVWYKKMYGFAHIEPLYWLRYRILSVSYKIHTFFKLNNGLIKCLNTGHKSSYLVFFSCLNPLCLWDKVVWPSNIYTLNSITYSILNCQILTIHTHTNVRACVHGCLFNEDLTMVLRSVQMFGHTLFWCKFCIFPIYQVGEKNKLKQQSIYNLGDLPSIIMGGSSAAMWEHGSIKYLI